MKATVYLRAKLRDGIIRLFQGNEIDRLFNQIAIGQESITIIELYQEVN